MKTEKGEYGTGKFLIIFLEQFYHVLLDTVFFKGRYRYRYTIALKRQEKERIRNILLLN